MRIIDRRSQALGGQNNDRTVAQITHIVIHHSANLTGLANLRTANFENGWRNNPNMGAPNNVRGGYHEVVLFSGDVERNYDDRRIVWGARNQNTHTWHIAVVGQHGAGVNNITAVQLRSLEKRVFEAYRRLNIRNLNHIVVHNGLPGQATACTSINVANVRTAVSRLLSPASPPATTSGTHTIRQGDTLWSLSRTWNVPISAIERVNPGINPANLQIGQRINRPGNAGTSSGAIVVESRVRVNNNAVVWATGQTIPAWVRGQVYTVRQMRSNNTELLLAGINSWIRRSDVTLV